MKHSTFSKLFKSSPPAHELVSRNHHHQFVTWKVDRQSRVIAFERKVLHG